MLQRIETLKDVVDWGLCTGCGACYYACTKGGVTLVNIESVGIRPRFDSSQCASCTGCLPICPGYSVDAELATGPLPETSEADHEFGSALEIWEGHATDPEIRYRASSGGVLTALSLYCLEHESMNFVLHTAMDEERPWCNTTVKSRTRDELLSRTGSRYAPASPCDGLGAIEESQSPCVFIGKPCDAAAVSMLRRERPQLDRNLGLVLTFFCAGTPSTQGTLDLARSQNVRPEQIDSVRYRGEGWPGAFKILYDNRSREQSLSYIESWGNLTHYRSLRCNLCPDGLGRVADISCGDAWEHDNNDGDPGRSLVIVRTPRGREIVRRAMAANYVQLTPGTPENVLAAQPNLLRKRRELFGRLAGLRLFMAPVPTFRGFSLMRGWMRLTVSHKARTFLGTIKRVMIRRLWQCRPLFDREARILDGARTRMPVRVCMLVYAFYESDTRVLQYTKALADRGDSVDVFALRREGTPAFEVMDGVDVYRVQSRKVNERGRFAYLVRILRFLLVSAFALTRKHLTKPYDVVHVHSVPDFLVFASLVPKLLGAHVVLDIHDILPEFYASKFGKNSDSLLFKLMLGVERLSSSFADHVIIANHIWQERLMARSVPAHKCATILNYPDSELFYTREEQPDSKKFVIIYPGTLNYHQGVDVAIHAFALSVAEMPDAEFHIYGEGPAKSTLTQLAEQLEVSGRIFFHDFLPTRQIADIMARADLAVVPKRASSVFGNEAASTKIAEFMSLGVPVIISRTKVDTFYHEDSRVKFFNSEDARDLARCILLLYRDPALRRELSTNASNYVRQNCWSDRKRDYLSLIDNLCSPLPDAPRFEMRH